MAMLVITRGYWFLALIPKSPCSLIPISCRLATSTPAFGSGILIKLYVLRPSPPFHHQQGETQGKPLVVLGWIPIFAPPICHNLSWCNPHMTALSRVRAVSLVGPGPWKVTISGAARWAQAHRWRQKMAVWHWLCGFWPTIHLLYIYIYVFLSATNLDNKQK
jgi:hypothetical protein